MTRKMEADSRHHETVIIGAGISGLACASRLLEHPSYQQEKSLLVLEARDRIGGRIESVHVNGNRLDTGANWIHGVGTKDDPNPLVAILPNKHSKELSCSVSFRPSSFKTDPTTRQITESNIEDWVKLDPGDAPYAEQSGKDLVIPSNISKDLFGALWALMASLHENAAKAPAESAFQTTMLAAITKDPKFKTAFEGVPVQYHQTLRALPQFIEAMEAGPLHYNSAEHVVDHPGMGLSEFSIDDFDGIQVFLGDGYTAVAEEVGKDVIKRGLIKLGTQVEHISWDNDPIVISTRNGQYTADRVVCTIPLGVLQVHIRSLQPSPMTAAFFSPKLPTDKLEAINSLGFGTLDKIFTVYDTPWWTDEPYKSILKKGLINRPMLDGDNESADKIEAMDFHNMWGFTDELPGLAIGPGGDLKPGVRALSVINLHALTGFPVLSSFVSCANAVHVEGLSNHAAGMIVHRSLTKWLGREPPLPDAVHVTRWAHDEHSRGSYSHMITGLSKTSHREAFQKPIINRHGAELRFAGEHTSRNHFATVHGALLSGWREAEAIIERGKGEPQ